MVVTGHVRYFLSHKHGCLGLDELMADDIEAVTVLVWLCLSRVNRIRQSIIVLFADVDFMEFVCFSGFCVLHLILRISTFHLPLAESARCISFITGYEARS